MSADIVNRVLSGYFLNNVSWYLLWACRLPASSGINISMIYVLVDFCLNISEICGVHYSGATLYYEEVILCLYLVCVCASTD